MMVTVLLRAKAAGLLDAFPSLSAYVARGEARPAYARAFAAQLAVFTARSNFADRRLGRWAAGRNAGRLSSCQMPRCPA